MRMCFIPMADACTAVDEGRVGLLSAPRFEMINWKGASWVYSV